MIGVLDLNADLGELPGPEGEALDAALLDVVTSASIACGGHAGDEASMARVCALAAARGVSVGAHVSYADREGFGRRRPPGGEAELEASLVEQFAALAAAAAGSGATVAYVKPHGALYHAACADDATAAAVVGAALAQAADSGVAPAVLGAPGSRLLALAAQAGLPVMGEAFADRGYTATGALVPRGEPGAVVDDADEVVRRVLAFAATGSLPVAGAGPGAGALSAPGASSPDGATATWPESVAVDAGSLCLHSDTPGAVALARAVRAALEASGVTLRPFARPPAAR